MKTTALEEQKYLIALEWKSWVSLVAYPHLLYRWQYTHMDPKTNMRIAAIASHRLGRHRYCSDVQICKKIGLLMRKCLIQDIRNVLRKRIVDNGQLTLMVAHSRPLYENTLPDIRS